jgi:hypothetical protein
MPHRIRRNAVVHRARRRTVTRTMCAGGAGPALIERSTASAASGSGRAERRAPSPAGRAARGPGRHRPAEPGTAPRATRSRRDRRSRQARERRCPIAVDRIGNLCWLPVVPAPRSPADVAWPSGVGPGPTFRGPAAAGRARRVAGACPTAGAGIRRRSWPGSLPRRAGRTAGAGIRGTPGAGGSGRAGRTGVTLRSGSSSRTGRAGATGRAARRPGPGRPAGRPARRSTGSATGGLARRVALLGRHRARCLALALVAIVATRAPDRRRYHEC